LIFIIFFKKFFLTKENLGGAAQ